MYKSQQLLSLAESLVTSYRLSVREVQVKKIMHSNDNLIN